MLFGIISTQRTLEYITILSIVIALENTTICCFGAIVALPKKRTTWEVDNKKNLHKQRHMKRIY
jgi:hypothetical protein